MQLEKFSKLFLLLLKVRRISLAVFVSWEVSRYFKKDLFVFAFFLYLRRNLLFTFDYLVLMCLDFIIILSHLFKILSLTDFPLPYYSTFDLTTLLFTQKLTLSHALTCILRKSGRLSIWFGMILIGLLLLIAYLFMITKSLTGIRL